MVAEQQASTPAGTATIAKERSAKQRMETTTTDASSGYATDDSLDLEYSTVCSASSLPSRMASDCSLSAENIQEVSQFSNVTSTPASVGPQALLGLTLQGTKKRHPRGIFMIDLPTNFTDAHTNMQIAAARTPVGSPTASGRRTEAWRRQRVGSAKEASDPVHQLLRVASRRLFQSASVPQQRDGVDTSHALGRSLTSVRSLRPTMANQCAVAQPPSTQLEFQASTCKHMNGRICSHAATQNPADKCAWQFQTERKSGFALEAAEPLGVPCHFRSPKQDVPMKIMQFLPTADGTAHLNPLEPVYKQVSVCLREDTFGKALQHLCNELITPPPGLDLPCGDKPASKNHVRACIESLHAYGCEGSTKREN